LANLTGHFLFGEDPWGMAGVEHWGRVGGGASGARNPNDGAMGARVWRLKATSVTA
jgi:hypothetical protein